MVIEEPDIRHFPVKLIAITEKLALMRSHFLSPQKIADLFQKLPAKVFIEFEPPNAFVVVQRMFDDE